MYAFPADMQTESTRQQIPMTKRSEYIYSVLMADIFSGRLLKSAILFNQ